MFHLAGQKKNELEPWLELNSGAYYFFKTEQGVFFVISFYTSSLLVLFRCRFEIRCAVKSYSSKFICCKSLVTIHFTPRFRRFHFYWKQKKGEVNKGEKTVCFINISSLYSIRQKLCSRFSGAKSATTENFLYYQCQEIENCMDKFTKR